MNPFTYDDRAMAERDAYQLKARRLGEYAVGYEGEPAITDRIVTDYAVKRYPGTAGFGITERWVYNDQRDLGEFGGGFLTRLQIKRMLGWVVS